MMPRPSFPLTAFARRLALPVLLAALAMQAAVAEPTEYAIKAAYLYKFGAYVEWPGTAFTAPTTALTLCVVGDDPFGPTLDEAVNGQRVGGRPVVVRRLKALAHGAGCHIAYVGIAEPQRAQQTLELARGDNVLTVTDAKGGSVPGVIQFVIKDNRVRFDIDADAAAQSGLTVSSKLLSLALNVKK